jgi:hypothetical protein
MEKDPNEMTTDEYYQYYLSLHKNPWNKLLHVAGQLFTITWFMVFLYLGFYVHWLWFTPLYFLLSVVYIFTDIGHKYFEKNVPARKANRWRAKAADWRMFFDILRGKVKIF